jgi:hypothetical protein
LPRVNRIVAQQAAEDESGAGFDGQMNSNKQDGNENATMDDATFSNMMNGFSSMDYTQMMQMMASNGMAGFNPMMGKSRFFSTSNHTVLTILSRYAYGSEPHVRRHVWRARWPKRKLERNEWLEYGNEL